MALLLCFPRDGLFYSILLRLSLIVCRILLVGDLLCGSRGRTCGVSRRGLYTLWLCQLLVRFLSFLKCLLELTSIYGMRKVASERIQSKQALTHCPSWQIEWQESQQLARLQPYLLESSTPTNGPSRYWAGGSYPV